MNSISDRQYPQKIHLKYPQKIHLKYPQKIHLKYPQKIHLKYPQKIHLKYPQKIHLKYVHKDRIALCFYYNNLNIHEKLVKTHADLQMLKVQFLGKAVQK